MSVGPFKNSQDSDYLTSLDPHPHLQLLISVTNVGNLIAGPT